MIAPLKIDSTNSPCVQCYDSCCLHEYLEEVWHDVARVDGVEVVDDVLHGVLHYLVQRRDELPGGDC